MEAPSWQQGAPTVWELLEGPGSILAHFFCDLWEYGRSVKTTDTRTLLKFLLGLESPLQVTGGCLGRVWGAMLEDVSFKMVFCWLS